MSPEKLTSLNNGEEDKTVAEKAESEELPPGWMIDVKTRKGSSGKKVDRYYTDPVTKYTFRSLKEVHRYLKTGRLGRLAIKPKDDNGVGIDSETKSGEPEKGSEGHRKRTKSGEKSEPELTQGASKRLAAVKPDAPLSPTERKTRQATRLTEIKTDAPLSSPERKTRQTTKLAGIKTDAPSSPEAKTRQATKLAGIKTGAPSPSEAKTRQPTKLAGIKTGAPPSSPSELKTSRATKLAEIKTDAPSPSPSERKTRQATKLAGIKIDAPSPSPSELKTRQPTKLAGIKTDAPSPPVAKTRQAKRLAGVEVDATPPSPPEPKTRRQAVEKEAATRANVNLATQKASNKKAKEEKSNADVDFTPNLEQKISFLSTPVTQDIPNDDITVNKKQESHTVLPPVTHTVPVPQPLPAAAPPASLTVDPPVSLTFDPSVNNPNDLKPESSVNFSLNDLWTDPCIEFAVKTLTGAIPFGDLNKSSDFPTSSPLEVPMGGLWTDPCIEFAVKTLTGAIPVTGDLSVQDYLQNQNQPTCSLPDVGMNSFCQTEVLSKHFENSNGNNNNKLPESTVRNGGLEKSGPQQVKGGNLNNVGQCSRGSRFYE